MTFNPQADISRSTAKSGVSKGAAAGGGVTLLGVVALILYACTGFNFMPLVEFGNSASQSNGQVSNQSPLDCSTGADANERDDCRLAGGQLSIDQFWTAQLGANYTPPQLVVLDGPIATPCGTASNQVGPFYCPPNQSIYVDPSFFSILRNNYGASAGDLAQLYILAHEYGHHVQNLIGVMNQYPNNGAGADSNGVRTELQADCFAGAWMGAMTQTTDANGNPYLLAPTQQQLADAVNAAAAVGDDHIQSSSGFGRVNPESFTHGTSDQRQRWLAVGYQYGWEKCDEVWHTAGNNL